MQVKVKSIEKTEQGAGCLYGKGYQKLTFLNLYKVPRSAGDTGKPMSVRQSPHLQISTQGTAWRVNDKLICKSHSSEKLWLTYSADKEFRQ